MEEKMYILVNEDIKISKGKLAGQVGHAVASYMFNVMKEIESEGKSREFRRISDYMKEQKKVILRCPESELVNLEDNESYNAIRDKGITHLKPGTLTCVNIGIYNDSNVPEWVKKLKLY